MAFTDRPVRLLTGLGLVLAGLLAGILATLWVDREEARPSVVRVVKQVRPATPASRPVSQTDSERSEAPAPSALNRLFRDVAERVTDAVVSVRVQAGAGGSTSSGSLGRRSRNLGSGVLISPDGYIVTNRHVVKGADAVQVTLADKRQYEGEIVGTDSSTDLAVVKIDGASDFPVLPLGNSDRVAVGDWVVAIGNPFRLTSTVTAGIVSALGRQLNIIEDQFRIENFIQTDAAINPGNSGGALVNLQGELVGINTAIASGTGAYEGYGFAIPSALVERVTTDLIAYGEVRRGYLGVAISDVNAETAEEAGLEDIRGVYVGDVQAGSAAAESGIESGDVILAIEGEQVGGTGDLQSIVALRRPGDVVSVRVWRDGAQRTFEVRLMGEDTPVYQDWLSDLRSGAQLESAPDGKSETQPDAEAPSDSSASAVLDLDAWGFGVRALTPAERSRFGVDDGVYVAYVERDRPAAEAGLSRGVVVTALNDQTIDALPDVPAVLEAAEGPLRARVKRPDGTSETLEIEQPIE